MAPEITRQTQEYGTSQVHRSAYTLRDGIQDRPLRHLEQCRKQLQCTTSSLPVLPHFKAIFFEPTMRVIIP